VSLLHLPCASLDSKQSVAKVNPSVDLAPLLLLLLLLLLLPLTMPR
jgi:hypothetical protein